MFSFIPHFSYVTAFVIILMMAFSNSLAKVRKKSMQNKPFPDLFQDYLKC